MNKILLAVTLTVATGILSGCQVQQEQHIQTKPVAKQIIKRPAFPIDEYEALAKKGTGKVKGELFGVTRGGDVKIGAGKEITLRPFTSYMKYIPIDYETQEFEPMDSRVENYDRKTTTDAQGKFEFDNVPPGQYIVIGRFSWYAGSYPQFVNIYEKINVKNGEVTNTKPAN